MNKKLDARGSAWIKVLTLLVLLTAIGVVSEVFWHFRVDLTRGKDFTLGAAATRALDGLPDKVTVRVVMSKNLPPEFARVRTRVVDLLREFEARSGGRLELSFLSPEDSLDRITALSLGIEEIVFHERRRDGVQAKKGFFGLALLYRDKKEYFPVVQSVETFEYDLVVRLRRLTGTGKTIGFLEGSGGGRDFAVLKTRLEPLYKLESRQTKASAAFDSLRIDLMIVAAPESLGTDEKIRIDRFVMNGKPVIFLTPGIAVDLSAGIDARPVRNGYEDLLAHYGIGLRKELLVEPEQWERVRFGDAEFPMPYPYWLAVPYGSLSADNPVTASLSSLSFPWTSALAVDPAAQPAARYEILAASSSQSWEQNWDEAYRTGLYLRPLDAFVPGRMHAHPLAVMATGPMTSYVSPDRTAGTSRPSQPSREARLLVVSNALFVSDVYADYRDIESNLQFVLNAVDQLALDPDLIRVRSRQLPDEPLDEARADRWKPLLLVVNMLLGPLMILLVWGLVVALRRQREARA